MSNPPTGPPATILVVEDNDLVLEFVVKVLKAAQFHVLSAGTAAQALELAANPDTHVDLLLSDVNMPQMNGPDLGQALKKNRPDLHVMLMSSMAEGALLVLNYGWTFLEKPFVPKRLVQMVNNVLIEPNKSQSSHEFNARKDATLDQGSLRNDTQKNVEHPHDDLTRPS